MLDLIHHNLKIHSITHFQLATGFGTGFVANTTAQGLWSQNAQSTTFAGIGNVTYSLVVVQITPVYLVKFLLPEKMVV